MAAAANSQNSTLLPFGGTWPLSLFEPTQTEGGTKDGVEMTEKAGYSEEWRECFNGSNVDDQVALHVLLALNAIYLSFVMRRRVLPQTRL